MKRYLTIFIVMILTIVFLLFTITINAITNVEQSEESANSLVKLKVLTGYPDGSLKLDNKIRRSEFLTLIIKMLDYEKDTIVNNITIKFKDIDKTHWAYNNFKIAIKNNLVAGYPDNTILPNNNVTYAEALVITIRALGYEKSLVGKWPNNVLTKAEELGLNKNLKLEQNKQLTRGEASIILFNSLTVNLK